MTRQYLAIAAALGLTLSLGSPARAQIDLAKIRAGVQGCPELAADPGLGTLAAYLCDPLDRTPLDLPITRAVALIRVRAGSFSNLQRLALLNLARGALGESEYGRLRDLLISASVLSISQEGLRRALVAEGNLSAADALLAGRFDASIPELLATRIDRDRLADLRAGVLARLGGVDTVASYSGGLSGDLASVANLGNSPGSVDADGNLVFDPAVAVRSADPFFVGPDGIANTLDDLPYVTNNPAAQSAGYQLLPPIAGTVEDRFDSSAFVATAQILVPNASNPAGPLKRVEVYGVYNPAYTAFRGCTGLGTFDQATGTCTDSTGGDVTAQARANGCLVISRLEGAPPLHVGINADGDCIQINNNARAPAQLQYEVLDLLGDVRLRPVTAGVEPSDLTDLIWSGARPPARPVSPNGTTVFPPVIGVFRRSVDLVTGAPVRSSGGTCRVRVDGSATPIGPNGIAGDADDGFPSAGECLLWGPPGAGGAQALAPPATVAASHSANQTLFHELCTAGFDEDVARCSLGQFNDPNSFGFLSSILGGFGGLGGPVLDGLDTVRTRAEPLRQLKVRNSQILNFQFLALNSTTPTNRNSNDVGLYLERAQAALLGCGADFASPCSTLQASYFDRTPAIAGSVGAGRFFGGVDLLNTEAGVLVQEFATEKALHAGDLVGAANGSSYLPGMNYSRNGSFFTVVIPAVPGQSQTTVTLEGGAYLSLTPADVLAMSDAQRAAFQHGSPNPVQADGWVEPMPWTVDPVALSTFGAVVFQADATDPINGSANVFNRAGGQIYGEYCGRWMNDERAVDVATPFNQTCTALETISANLERLLIGTELLGRDRFFDPPESLAELAAMLDDDPSNDATGDPLSGPDGIFTRNAMVFSDSEMDFRVLEVRNLSFGQQLVVAPADKAAALAFLTSYDPNLSCVSTPECYLQVNAVLSDPTDPTSSLPLALDLPIAFTVDVIAEPTDPGLPVVTTGVTKVNLAALQVTDLSKLRRLMAGGIVELNGQFVQMNGEQRNGPAGLFGPSRLSFPARDMDGDATNDFDQDRDGVWDGMDDFTPGPVSDDEILCGSGIPGDSALQDGIQYEPYRLDQAPGSSQFRALFPNGLPPRSPVFCRSLNSLLGLIGTAPNGTRQFAWHGGIPTGAPDQDGDSFPDGLDNCPTVANPSQSDADGDGVGDLCDNCVNRANPRVGPDYLAQNPWATLTGGQRDDDRDGYGNRCDAKFPGSVGANVSTVDLAELLTALGHSRSVDDCGRTGRQACAIYDLDEDASMIGSPDRRVFNELLIGKRPGPKCPTCPLTCTSGPAGACP